MSESVGGRLDKLEAWCAELEARLAKIEPKAEPKPAVAPPAAAGVRVIELSDRSPVILPSPYERQRLRGIVLDFYPALAPTDTDPDAFVDDFNLAFDRIACAFRTEEPGKYSLGWWLDDCREFGRLRGMGCSITGNAFIVAAIAAGDIKYSRPDNAGNIWTFWLAPYGGRPASLAWRNEVLNGRLLQPTAGKFRQDYREQRLIETY